VTVVAVIGAGVMGSGIAQSLAVAGSTVHCQDLASEQLAQAAEAVRSGRYGVERSVALAKLSQDDADAALGRLTFTDSLEYAVDGVDLVVEAIPEKLGLKLRLFQELDRLAPARAVLASNSSGHPISALAEVTGRPELVIGWHWASPPVAMRFAEIVVHERTSESTIELVRELAAACGKNPVVVRENPRVWGYVANRIMAAVSREAALVVQEGLATPDEVDRLLMDAYRWPVGPFGLNAGATSGWT
jgi:3-hydroxyacyl-CoA dehydrogenase